MQLSRRARRGIAFWAALACWPAMSSGQDGAAINRVDVHGFYYRETSTRVIQPRVEVSSTLPNAGGVTVRGAYLLDAITSASIAAGAQRDNLLTEVRNEVAFGVTVPVDIPSGPARASLDYSRSRESDYDSDTIAGSVAFDLFEKNTTWRLGYSHTFDTVHHRLRRVVEGGLDMGVLSLYVTQILSPVTVGSLGFEWARLDGYQQNPYRAVTLGGTVDTEVVPQSRHRFTGSGRLAHLFVRTGTTLQALYRYYADNWDLNAHTVEGRVYQDLGDKLDLRIAYRFHTQDSAYFAKPGYVADPSSPNRDVFYTSDPKLFGFDSHYMEVQLRLNLVVLEDVPVLGWLAEATLDATFGMLYMGSRFGNCGPLDPNSQCQDRVVSLGMSMPLPN